MIVANTLEGRDLLFRASLALAETEARGMRIDEVYLAKTMADTKRKMTELEVKLREGKIWRTVWQKRFGSKAKLSSDDQLRVVLFDELGYTPHAFTDTGKAKVNAESLGKIKEPWILDYLKYAKYEKMHGTYLKGIHRETVNGFLHTTLNTHLVITYRTSSSGPNLQNVPIRDPEIGNIVRRCFIPREGKRRIVELDFKRIEVVVAACYHKDPTMIEYIEDEKNKCMHRDMAREIYMLDKPWQVSKDTRHTAKNQFVFPTFYGSYYAQMAPHLWESVDIRKLEIATKENNKGGGGSLRDHLKAKGIKKLGACDPEQKPKPGTFEKHLQEIERDFWDNRFPVYKQWKYDWYEKYLRRGYIDMLTGFRCQGFAKKNEIINYAVQGSASHCKLWCLIMLQEEFKRRKLKSYVVLEIHDSLVLDVAERELETVLEIAVELMTRTLPKVWKWIIAPLGIEAEAAPVGGGWNEKKEIALAA